MQPQRIPVALGMLAAIIAVGLLFGPAGFGRGEQRAEASLGSEVKKLLASDAQGGDNFGTVAVSGDTAVVGAIFEDSAAGAAGAAYIFQRDEGGTDNWGEVKKLTASDAETSDQLGASVAISGDTVVVGAIGEDAGGSEAGAAYVFERDQGGAGNWGEVKKLTASDAQSDAELGFSVAVSGDTAVVGAIGRVAAVIDPGAAYVFQRDEGGADNWGEVKKLTASDAEGGDAFGWSVTISGDTVIAGARAEAAGGPVAGAAYVFGRDQGGVDSWGEVKKLTASDAAQFDDFGVSVALSGDTAIVGAGGEDGGASEGGSAYVFERDQGGAGNWGEVTKLIASDAQAADIFGASVEVSGDTAVVGAPLEDAGDSDAGAAYVFARDEGGADNWGETGKLLASDAEFRDGLGSGVALSGGTAVVGARGEDTGGASAGAAYVFDLLQPKPTPCPTGKVPAGSGCGTPVGGATPKGPDGDTDGDTIPNSSDLDDDNDGCLDHEELGSQQSLGGLRNPHFYWDFMDMWVNDERDGRINIVDIGAVVLRLFTAGDPGGDPLDPPQDTTSYHVSADRSPPTGPNVWNAGPPDGDINILDLGLTVVQFGHICLAN